jgi:hypothetical protein
MIGRKTDVTLGDIACFAAYMVGCVIGGIALLAFALAAYVVGTLCDVKDSMLKEFKLFMEQRYP